jgi:hypothetical protein
MSFPDNTTSAAAVTGGAGAAETTLTPPGAGTTDAQALSTGNAESRTVAVWALIVVSSLLVVLSTIAVGVELLLLNTDRWTATVGPLASDPTVQASVADAAATQTLNALDLHGRVASLPAPLQSVAAPIEAAVASFVDDQALKLMQSPQFPVLWTDLNRAVHPAVVQLLRGETPPGGAVTVTDGAVQINTAVVVQALLERVGQVAPDVLGGQLPAILGSSASPNQLQQRIADAVGRQLPADFGRVTVMQSSSFAAAQRAVQILDAATWILVVAALVSIVVTLVLSVDRGLTTVRLGAGVAIGMLIAGVLLLAVQNGLAASLAGYPLSGAIQTALAAALQSVAQLLFVAFIVGAVVAGVAFVVRRRKGGSTVTASA